MSKHPKGEMPPELTEEDDAILDRIWNALDKRAVTRPEAESKLKLADLKREALKR